MMIKWLLRAADTLLDQLILPSYTWPGYALRALTWNSANVEQDMTGQVCLITGANAGLGLATAERLARLGATVYMVARSLERGSRARDQVIAKTGNDRVHLAVLDVSDLTAVTQFVAQFRQQENRLDVLINNASVLLPQRQTSVDGLEQTLATNLIGPFLLTNLLVPLLQASAPARIIWVSSGGMYTQKLDIDMFHTANEPYNGTTAYAQTKRAQIVLTELMAERLAGSGVTVNAMHPGWVDTPGVQSSLPTFRKVMRLGLRSAHQGADTIVWLAAAPQPAHISGQFWFDRRARGTHKFYLNTRSSDAERRQLWAECQRLSASDGLRPMDTKPARSSPLQGTS
ncbi:MAG: SDR family oxidoreductase [Chloroflexi bacterium]|nr:SDR family oxidoreductase [Chloroflexota bacterium]